MSKNHYLILSFFYFTCAANGGGDIESATLLPASCTNEKYAIQRTITVTPEIKVSGIAIEMDLWLDINELGSGLSQSEYFKYALTTVENDCTTGVVSEGRFTGLSSENNDKVMLLDGEKYSSSELQTYYLYIWIDPLEENNYIVDQPFNFSLGGTCSALYTIKYDVNGGEGTFVTQNKGDNEIITLSNEIPTKAGYKFLGWSTEPDATSVEYQAGDEYTLDKSTVLYAVWTLLSPIDSYSCANGSVGSEPYLFTYTGDCDVIDDGNGDWRMKLLSSGTFTIINEISAEAFLVGGGGGGGKTGDSYFGAGGGGGGYTTTSVVNLEKEKEYNIIIGNGGGPSSSGGATTGFDLIANGGGAGSGLVGGAGGSGGGGGGYSNHVYGGLGGENGSNGVIGHSYGGGGKGQGISTYEFGDNNLTLYAGGGGGGAGHHTSGSFGNGGNGGAGGGGTGGRNSSGISALPNTGGGGGGGSPANVSGGYGGSGIVVIRNIRYGCTSGEINLKFKYFGMCEAIDDGDENWRIKFLTSGTFISYDNINIEAFLVGGGGGGGRTGDSYYGAGGGGGGYTTTSVVNLEKEKEYNIIIGNGGGPSSSGGVTTGFDLIANGGGAGSGLVGGAGGSGGGGGGYSGHVYGGNGGENGSNGVIGHTYGGGGKGQGFSTYEFGDNNLTLYAGGGGGGAGISTSEYGSILGNGGKGGSGGGGAGGRGSVGETAEANTGGGGGGGSPANVSGGSGGSGIAIIRNKR